MTKISVILPTYNRGYLLKRSLSSITNQTIEDVEIIVVDDGSTDNTESVVKSFDDDRIEYIRHEVNKGANAARNTGISESNGAYIAFQDSDDVWVPHKLEKQINVFEQSSNNLAMVYCGVCRIWPDYSTDYLPGEKGVSGDITESLVQSNFIPTQAALVRKSCIDSVGNFDERLPRLQDWEMWLRISKKYTIDYVDEPLVINHMDVDKLSFSNRDTANAEALKIILDKHAPLFSEYPKHHANHYLILGVGLAINGDSRQGRKYMKESIKHNVSVRNVGAYIASYLPGKQMKMLIDYYNTLSWHNE